LRVRAAFFEHRARLLKSGNRTLVGGVQDGPRYAIVDHLQQRGGQVAGVGGRAGLVVDHIHRFVPAASRRMTATKSLPSIAPV